MSYPHRESLSIEPQAAIHNDLGFVLERQGLHEEAAEQYRKALELDPDSSSAHHNLAASLARGSDLESAELHFRAALGQQTGASAAAGLGFVLWKQGRADLAIELLQKAIDAEPEQAAAHQQLSEILVAEGRLGEAVESYRALLRNRPDPAARQELAKVLTRLGRAEEAQEEMERAQGAEPGPRGTRQGSN